MIPGTLLSAVVPGTTLTANIKQFDIDIRAETLIILPVKLVSDKEFLYSSPQGVYNTLLIKTSTRATSRHPEDGSTSYLRGRPICSMALPDTKQVGRGLMICRGGRPIVTCIALLCAVFV